MKSKWTLLLQQADQQLNQNKKRNTRMAVIRFVLFLAVAWSFFNLVDGHNLWWLIMIPCLVLFFIAMQHHHKINRRTEQLKARISVCQKLIDRNDGQWKLSQADPGNFPDDPQWIDLDVFSGQSLFHFIDMTTLPQGRAALIRFLSTTADLDEILDRQKTVRALLDDQDFLIRDWTTAHQLSQDQAEAMNREHLEQWIRPIPLICSETVVKCMPVIFALLLILTLVGWIDPVIFILYFFIQSALALFSMASLQQSVNALSSMRQGLQYNMDRLSALQQSSLHSPAVDRIRIQLTQQGGINENIRKIDRILDLFSIRANPFLSLPLQLVLLWDMQCACSWNRLQKKAGDQWVGLMEQIGELEALESLCVIALTHQKTCFPEFSQEPVLQFKDMIHPLIEDHKAVGNSFTLDHSITLITGSNMSGKTTFMRTVGLNQILAMAGSCVCAEKMTTSRFTVLTSMKITDNVNEGISTFYQELLRIRKIIEAIPTQKPLLVLIDEIFKGTNSLDRIEGGRRILRQLNQPQIRAMITTHDFELCDMEQEDLSLVNIHFEEQFIENRISFDYRLKEGRCNQRNARYLMKMIGLDD